MLDRFPSPTKETLNSKGVPSSTFELDSDECTNYDEDSPPECLMDCEGIENINPEQNRYRV